VTPSPRVRCPFYSYFSISLNICLFPSSFFPIPAAIYTSTIWLKGLFLSRVWPVLIPKVHRDPPFFFHLWGRLPEPSAPLMWSERCVCSSGFIKPFALKGVSACPQFVPSTSSFRLFAKKVLGHFFPTVTGISPPSLFVLPFFLLFRARSF